MPDPLAILDACSLINLYASGYFKSILSSQPVQFCIVEQVKNESLSIRKQAASETDDEYEAIVLDPYFLSGQLKLMRLETEDEKGLFVNLASRIDDGEAATFSIAITRNLQVVTDDRKAIRILKQEAPNIICLSTLDVMKTWSEMTSIGAVEIKQALKNIFLCANYRPSKKHYLFNWWVNILER